MRWLRENWLDLFIFLLIALVAAGIVLYLTGVNPFARPSGQVIAPQAPEGTPSPPPVTPPASLPQPPAPEEEKAPEPVVTVLPLPQAPAEPQAEAKEVAPPSPSGQASRPVSPAPQGSYRVAVGAFSSPENAARLRQELVQKGYPVRLEPAGNLTRVVVGPYASEAEAQRVAQALAAYGAQVYRGQGAAPPPQGAIYLQVGAFQKEENALALADKLKGMGFPVVLVKDGVYRVRVGPVAEGEKEAVKEKIAALGLEALEVR